MLEVNYTTHGYTTGLHVINYKFLYVQILHGNWKNETLNSCTISMCRLVFCLLQDNAEKSDALEKAVRDKRAAEAELERVMLLIL